MNLITSDVSQWARDVMKEKDVNYFARDFSDVYDFKYSVAARVANTALYLEVSYLN
jgi:phosphopantetheine adenylyltransferase